MRLESKIRVLAGTMVLTSIALSHFVHPYFIFLAVFVGLNLIQSAFTGFCPAEKMLAKLSGDEHARKTAGSCCGS